MEDAEYTPRGKRTYSTARPRPQARTTEVAEEPPLNAPEPATPRRTKKAVAKFSDNSPKPTTTERSPIKGSTETPPKFKSPIKPLDPNANAILAVRLIATEQLQRLETSISPSDADCQGMLDLIHKLKDEAKWGRLIFYMSHPHDDFYDEGRRFREVYAFTRWDVISKMLDFVELHVALCETVAARYDHCEKEKDKEKEEEKQGAVEGRESSSGYRLLWAYTQIEESIPDRIITFLQHVLEKGKNLDRTGSVSVKKYLAGEKGLQAKKWIELFQVDEAVYQEEEELLDYRIW